MCDLLAIATQTPAVNDVSSCFGCSALPCALILSLLILITHTQRETLAGGVDLVICTPGRFSEHLAAGNVNLEAAKAVVMDEVDVLMGKWTLTHMYMHTQEFRQRYEGCD